MKRLYTILIAMVALVLFAQTAVEAAPDLHSWSDILGNSRFKVLSKFGGAAVLDNETGLVWEQSPDMNGFNWLGAQSHCNVSAVGNRLGWRLPTLQEPASLVNPSAAGAPFLPAGHPFSNVQSYLYWSATTFAGNTDFAWSVNFDSGGVGAIFHKVFDGRLVWCVRGGQGVDPQ